MKWMVPKKPLLRLDLRLVSYVAAGVQEYPSGKLLEEFPRSSPVVFLVQRNVSMKVTLRLSVILRVCGL